MQRYTKLGYSIMVEVSYPTVPTDYVIRADIMKTGDKNSDAYSVKFEIQAKGDTRWEAIPFSDVTIHSRNINLDVCDYIEYENEKGSFVSAIADYNYHSWCLYEGDKAIRNDAWEEDR